jgi:hypothetical protein
MLRYKINSYPSRKIQQKYLYAIKTRNSIYGVHKESESDVSKTSLVLFMQEKNAKSFKEYLEKCQEEKVYYNRVIENDTVAYGMPLQSSSKMPLRLQRLSTKNLQLMCVMNYFDMLIVSKVEACGSVLDLYCFEYLFNGVPSRSMVELSLREMLDL